MSPKAKRQYCTWDDQTMEIALAEIEEGVSINKAAKEFSIPKQTLSDRKNQRWKTTTPGQPTVLTTAEETALINYCKCMASISQPLTVTGIKAFAWAIAKRHNNFV